MARSQRQQARLAPYKLGLIGGAAEFEQQYPKEMMKLGCLTACWSVAEDALCQVLAILLSDKDKAEAAFYSSNNHKARSDMVRAVAARSSLDERAKEYLDFGLDTLAKAANARNELTHGLFHVEPYSGELLSVRRRPATKVPVITKSGILKNLGDAITLCELAINVLQGTIVAITNPQLIDDVLSGRTPSLRRPP